MRILILCHAFNSLSQRVFAELERAGHDVSVELDIGDEVTREAVRLFEPDAVVAPFLKRRIPDDVWQAVPCLIVHPGPPGDRGPNALDWAVLDDEPQWGVSIIRATGELDGGPVLAAREFPMRRARKSSLYRFEVTEAAVGALFEALDLLADNGQPAADPVTGRWRDSVPADRRRIDWDRDDTAAVLTKIASADGQPGASARIAERELRLFDARPEPTLAGRAGELLATCREAVCVGTRDGAVWIGHARPSEPGTFKQPAVDLLADAVGAVDEMATSLNAADDGRGSVTYRERGPVGVLEFDFYNGAMSRRACAELLDAWRHATARPTRVIVLAGGSDFWSNGMDLNSIEAAESPADESWANIQAIDEVAEAVITTTGHVTVSALGGNAAAGGAFLALAADHVWARDGVVLNPHYKNMGNLYGSEYWTYLLPRRVGAEGIEAVMGRRLPVLASDAAGLGLIDAVGPDAPAAFREWVAERAGELAGDGWSAAREAKQRRREADEAERPLEDYRADELERMRMNFYGFDPSYHVARFRLVRRTPHAWTPLHLARHRRLADKASVEPPMNADERG
ncbi:MAG: enoyl-CoA hydratase-related protein [Candidatus Wenzhouxiangella sp. M2_3B_020]